MQPLDFDVIIIGQGIAGTTLAWILQSHGKNVLVLDEWAEVTSSKIAAGLVTPITGKRFVVSRDYHKFYKKAAQFYDNISALIGDDIFHERVSKRILTTDEEKEFWAKRQDDPVTQAYVTRRMPDGSGFEMAGAQLEVVTYLKKSRLMLNVEPKKVDWSRDVIWKNDYVELYGARARFIVSCEGYAAHQNPFFEWINFNAAKGEILQVRFKQKVDIATYHFGLWMAPMSEPNCFHVGATYDWDRLDNVPTEQGRAELEERLRKIIDIPYEVIGHGAAVRPIIFQSMAVIGTHPTKPLLGYFNGLGSKGSLQAPWYAEKLAEYLFGPIELDPEINVQKYWS